MVKPKSPALSKTSRLLDLVPYLVTHQNIPVKELAARFEVSKKELIDDLNTLWMCGLPGYTPLELIDLSFEDGFVSISNAQTLEAPRSLTGEELITLALGVDLLLQAQNLGADQREKIASLQLKLSKLEMSKVSISSTVDSAHRFTILNAIHSRSTLSIKYHSLVRDEISDRVLNPLSLYIEGGYEYLKASTTSGIRSFRLDRISAISIVDSVEKPVADISTVTKLLAKLRFLKPDRTSAEIFGLVDTFDPTSLNIQFECFSPEWLVRAVLSSSAGVELMGPLEVRHEVKVRAAKLLEIYQSDELPV